MEIQSVSDSGVGIVEEEKKAAATESNYFNRNSFFLPDKPVQDNADDVYADSMITSNSKIQVLSPKIQN